MRQGKRTPHNGMLGAIARLMDAPVETYWPAKYGPPISL